MSLSELKALIFEELRAAGLVEGEDNPWAICTASVGRGDKKKYERCVQAVKAKNAKK